jgi:uncharacterized protein
VRRYLLDVNTVLALLDPRHVFDETAQAWAAAEPEALWLTCPLVQNGVIRVAAHASYPNSLGTVRAVREVLQSFCDSPRHEHCPDDISLLEDEWIAQPEALTPSRLTDLYLVALARHHRARLATFDRRIPAEAIVGGREAVFLLGG